MTTLQIILLVVGVGVATVVLLVVKKIAAAWITCKVSDCPVGVLDFVGAYLRRGDLSNLAMLHVLAHKSGASLPFFEIEKHALARGDASNAVRALAASMVNGVGLTWEEITEMDLAGENPLEAVHEIIGGDA